MAGRFRGKDGGANQMMMKLFLVFVLVTGLLSAGTIAECSSQTLDTYVSPGFACSSAYGIVFGGLSYTGETPSSDITVTFTDDQFLSQWSFTGWTVSDGGTLDISLSMQADVTGTAFDTVAVIAAGTTGSSYSGYAVSADVGYEGFDAGINGVSANSGLSTENTYPAGIGLNTPFADITASPGPGETAQITINATYYDPAPDNVAPEPVTLLLIGAGLIAIARRERR